MVSNKEILEWLEIAISEAVIEVTTSYIDGDLTQAESARSKQQIRTRIDLFEGAIEREIDLELIDNPAYKELQRRHLCRVRQRQKSATERLSDLEQMRLIVLSTADVGYSSINLLKQFDSPILYSRLQHMKSSEEFKQAIRSGNINEAFLVAMSNAPELKITTKIITDRGKRVDASSSEIDNYLHTHISLIEGKIENEIGEKLTGDRYSEIKQFHAEQVTQAHQTIQHNLISLQKMFQLMSAFQQQAAKDSDWVDIAADPQQSLSAEPQPSRLYGNSPNVLKAGTTDETKISLARVTKNAEPQLPAFEIDDSVVDDLLSLADDDEATIETEEDRADWSQWLDDEPDIEPEASDFQSLGVLHQKPNWQNWALSKETQKSSEN